MTVVAVNKIKIWKARMMTACQLISRINSKVVRSWPEIMGCGMYFETRIFPDCFEPVEK